MIGPSPAQLEAWGASLREIDPSLLQEDPESGPVRWFLGDSGCEVFVWLDGQGAPHHLQLVFSRITVDWTADAGLQTGSFQGTSSTMGGRYDGYLLRERDVRDDRAVFRAARSLLRASTTGQELFAPLLTALEAVPGVLED